MSLIDNERTKLTANALDRASTACLAVGIFAPLGAVAQGQTHPAPGSAGLAFVGWFSGAIVLNLSARRVLRGLKS